MTDDFDRYHMEGSEEVIALDCCQTTAFRSDLDRGAHECECCGGPICECPAKGDRRILVRCPCDRDFGVDELRELIDETVVSQGAHWGSCHCGAILCVDTDLFAHALTRPQTFVCEYCRAEHIHPIKAACCSFCGHFWGSEVTSGPFFGDDTHTPKNER